MSFEANTGQADNRAKFFSRGNGYGLYLTGDGAVLVLQKGRCSKLPQGNLKRTGSSAAIRRPGLQRGESTCSHETTALWMQLSGARGGTAAPVGEEQLPGMANYFVGNDPAKWHTRVPTYAKVRYRNVYPGVDLVYYGNRRQLEYDFVVASGSDPKSIRLQFPSANALRVDADGNLVVKASGASVAFHRPEVYQVVNGRRKAVEGSFTLLNMRMVGFRLGSYNRGNSLVIDPVLVYSTYLGGDDDDYGQAIAVDSQGSVYVAGVSGSPDFPVTQGALQAQRNNSYSNACPIPFVSKLNPGGRALVYSTYLTGSACNDGNSANALAVDGSGNAYIIGQTTSADFPVTQGAFQTQKLETAAGFVSKLNPTGSALIYSTYLGGSGDNSIGDSARSLAVDSAGNAYVAGIANSTDFPVTAGAFQTTNKIVPIPAYGNLTGTNTFVTKLNSTGSALVYSSYVGGSGSLNYNGTGINGDKAFGLAVDSNGNAYIAGSTCSPNFPVTSGAFQPTYQGCETAFVTKVNPAGTALVYSTYLGATRASGSAGLGDTGSVLAVDSGGNAYVVGSALTDFPVTRGAFQTTNRSGHNAFVTKVNPTGTALVYSTYLGGSYGNAPGDLGTAVAVDNGGNAYIVGTTGSADFPVTVGAFQTTNKALASLATNAFVTKLNATGTALLYSTYLGGSGGLAGDPFSGETGGALALDRSGNAYITGSTGSTDFPVTAGAFQTTATNGIVSNVFVTKLNLSTTTTPSTLPSIASGGIVPVDGTASTIQPGEWVSIYGTNLASSTESWHGNFPVTLGDVGVTIDGRSAYLSFVSPTQINVQAPDDATTGIVQVVVTTSSGTTTSAVTLAAFAPSFLLLDNKHVAGVIPRSDGSGAYGGGTYDILGPTGNSLGYKTVAAKPGDTVALFALGLGPTNPVVPAGQAFSSSAPTTHPVSLFINTVSATPSFAGLSGAGVYQINLTVPEGLGTGDVPLAATVGGAQSQPAVVISLQ